MKKIFIKLFAFIGFFTMFLACNEYENLAYDGDSQLLFSAEEQIATQEQAGPGDYLITYGVTKKVEADHSVELVFDQAKSSAVLGTDFTIVRKTDVLPSGATFGNFQINITKAAAQAKKEAVFTLKSNTLANANFNKEVIVKFRINCPSALQGTYQYSTVNYFSPDGPSVVPGPVVGSVTFGTTPNDGEYSVTDASFGGYTLYGPGTVAANVKLKDSCGKLSFLGTNQYGDSFTISNVVVVGNKLTFRWDTSYGEYGTTTLTHPTGNWPALTN